jgi:uncharacterized protein YidB (DUF937 family)
MTFESITTQPVKVKPPVISPNERLLPEVLKLVRETPGGVAGLMKQFRDRGLGHVATALASRDGTRMILPQQIVHGLGTQQIEALATATKLDTRVVRTELVLLLPQVLEQLSNRNTVQNVAVVA